MRALATYHPAALVRGDGRSSAQTFLSDIRKAVRAIKGAPVDPPPTIIVNPPADHTVWEELEHGHLGPFPIAIDTETPGLASHRITSIALAWRRTRVVAMDWRNAPLDVRSRVREALGRPDTIKVFQNAAFDVPILEQCGLPVEGPLWDTMIAGYVLEPDDWTNLSHLASLYLDVEPWKHLAERDPLRYNGLDAAYASWLYWVLSARLAQTGQLKFFEDHLMPLLRNVILPLNQRGLMCDRAALKRLNDEWRCLLGSWSSRVADHFVDLSRSFGRELVLPVRLDKAGKPIGDSLSSKKTQQLLYDVLGLPVQHHPTTGRPTADRHALAKLEPLDQTGTLSLLLERSRLKENENHLRIKHSQDDRAGLFIDRDGRVRSRYVLGGDEKHRELTARGTSRARDKGPSTGRLASRSPNHQNIPQVCRQIYVPSHPDWWLVNGDSSQIEARLTQWFSGDANLKAALDEGDVYLYTCWLVDQLTGIYNVCRHGWQGLKKLRKRDDPPVGLARDESKRTFLGWSYRMGPKKIELHYGVPFARAKEIVRALNSAFPGVVQMWERLISEAHAQHCLANPFGRRRYFHDPASEVPEICNFLAQSTAADILFYCQRKLVEALNGRGHLVATVHDSNLVEGPDQHALASIVRAAMESPIDCMGGFTVPCEIKAGKNWYEMETIPR